MVNRDAVKRLWESGKPLPSNWTGKIVSCSEIAYITSKSPSTVRAWQTRKSSPLYGKFTKTDATPENPTGSKRGTWVLLLGTLFAAREAFQDYRPGPVPVENFKADRHKKNPNRKRRRRLS